MSDAKRWRILESLRIADLAFDVNLLVSLKQRGYTIKEVPIEWTDQLGSKVTANLWRVSLVMFLSVVRLRLVHSPLYNWLRPLRPLETWLYLRLNALRLVRRRILSRLRLRLKSFSS